MTEGVELVFWAGVHSLEGEGRLATFYIMDMGLNRNNWRVTDEALEQALPTLLRKPLGCIPGYRVDHVHVPQVVGRWVGTEKPDGYALATAEVTDDVAWRRLEGGEWGPVSVVISASRVACSACGRDITGAPDEHVLVREAHEVIEDFRFERVDFVQNPAYPRADLVTLGYAGEATVRQSSLSTMDGSQGARAAGPDPEGKRERQEMEGNLEELRQELETVRGEKQRLEKRLKAVEAERHDDLVASAVEARVKAGLARDWNAETARLKALDDDTLRLLAEDAERVAGSLARAQYTGPRARYTPHSASAFEAAVESTRERLFGYRREAGA